jgi:hypothetical protein
MTDTWRSREQTRLASSRLPQPQVTSGASSINIKKISMTSHLGVGGDLEVSIINIKNIDDASCGDLGAIEHIAASKLISAGRRGLKPYDT